MLLVEDSTRLGCMSQPDGRFEIDVPVEGSKCAGRAGLKGIGRTDLSAVWTGLQSVS